MILIVGLGNPGDQYKNTRHNIGREILTEWQKKSHTAPFGLDKKLNALIAKNKKALLLAPETMMNKSGNAVASAARFYKVKPQDILVIHDDADIDLGRAKLSFGKHSAGHKGVESVKRALGTWDFWRFRIGIQKRKRVDAMKLVLQKFTPEENKLVGKTIKRTVAALQKTVAEGPEKTMNEYNK